eukprot:gene38696-50839_t
MESLQIKETSTLAVAELGAESTDNSDKTDAENSTKPNQKDSKAKGGAEKVNPKSESTPKDKSAVKPVVAPKSFARRDHIRSNELQIQKKWAESKVYQTERKVDENGMPIQAAANKLKDEMAKYGCPPIFPPEVTDDSENTEEKSAESLIANKSK